MNTKDNTIYFAKSKKEAIIPYKRDEDAGYDVHVIIERNLENKERNFIVIEPHKTVILETGICSAFDKKYVVLLCERSSTGILGISQRSNVIDSGYRGSWSVPVTNVSNKPIIIGSEESLENALVNHLLKEGASFHNKDNAVCQAIVIPIANINKKEITLEELKRIPSKRGCLGFGSTNKKGSD